MLTKLFLILSIPMLLALPRASAQINGSAKEMETLLGDKRIEFGWTATLRSSYTHLNARDAWLFGARGGAIINRSVVLGGGGYGIVNNPYQPNINGDGVYASGGYGGAHLEVILWQHKLVHASIPIIIGGGAISYYRERFTDGNFSIHDSMIDEDIFFVLEPGLDIELNIAPFFRLAAGASYRHTSELSLIGTEADAFRGLTYSLSLKFGSF